MQRDDIKERIKVEVEKFKLYIWLSVLTIGGSVGLLFKEGHDSFRFTFSTFGWMLAIGFICLVIYTYYKIESLFKKLGDQNYD